MTKKENLRAAQRARRTREQAVRQLCKEYIGISPETAACCIPSEAAKQCRVISEMFVDWAQTEGHKAFLVGLVGRPRFLCIQDDKYEHFAAEINGMIVDWTLRQFQPAATFPTIYSSFARWAAQWGDFEAEPQYL